MNYPELRFNFQFKRQQREAYLAHLVPLSVAAVLTFAVLISITATNRAKESLALDTAVTMAVLVGIFVAVLFAHLRLRSQFEGLVYFELFYFLSYAALLGVSLNNMLIAVPTTATWKIFTFGDNLTCKVLFWPSIMGAAVILSALSLPGDDLPFIPLV